MLTKLLDFFLDILKAIILPRLIPNTNNSTIKITGDEPDEHKSRKIAHNERVDYKKITGVNNAWAQKEVIKLCDSNTDVPRHDYFAIFDSYLKRCKLTNQLIFDENKVKFNRKESMAAYFIASAMFILCAILFWEEGAAVHSIFLIALLGSIGVIAFIGCLRLSPPSDRKIKEAKGFIEDYYQSVRENKSE